MFQVLIIFLMFQSVDIVRHMCEIGGRRFKLTVLDTLLESENLVIVPRKQKVLFLPNFGTQI